MEEDAKKGTFGPFQDSLQLLLLLISYCPDLVIWPNPASN